MLNSHKIGTGDHSSDHLSHIFEIEGAGNTTIHVYTKQLEAKVAEFADQGAGKSQLVGWTTADGSPGKLQYKLGEL